MNGIRYDNLSIAFATVRAHPDKNKNDFDAVVTVLTKYIDKGAPTPSMKVASVTQTRPAKWQKTSTTCNNFKGKIEQRIIPGRSMTQCLQHSVNRCMSYGKMPDTFKGKNTSESSRYLKARAAALKAKAENSSDESLFGDVEKTKANKRDNPALYRKGCGNRQRHTHTSNGNSWPCVLRNRYVKPLSTI